MRRLLPPILLVLVCLAMTAATFLMPIVLVFSWPNNLIGIPICLIGLSLAFAGARKFKSVETNIQTFGKPDHLVTAGLFAYSRNPMYLGFALAAFGSAILLGSFSAIIIAMAFIVVLDRWYVQFEETKMLETFGQDYTNYKKMVRRWL